MTGFFGFQITQQNLDAYGKKAFLLLFLYVGFQPGLVMLLISNLYCCELTDGLWLRLCYAIDINWVRLIF